MSLPPNNAPTVSGPVTVSVNEGAGTIVIDPLANASDPDGTGVALGPTGTLPQGATFTGAATVIDFESYTSGTVVGQNGWTDASPSSPANAIVDVGGNKKLLLANDPSSGDFGGPYAPAFGFKVGETATGAQGDTLKVSFTIQAVNAAADGSRIEIDLGKETRDDRYNFMAVEYTSQGLRLVQNSPLTDGNWANNNFDFGTGSIQLGTYLDPTVAHNIEVVFRAVDGSNNDIVEYYVNGTLVGTGSTFENYSEFHLGQPHAPSAVNTVLFRAGEPAGNPFPADGAGGNRQGFYVDNLSFNAYDSNSLTFDANNAAYNTLGAGQSQQVVVTYDVMDGQGGVTPTSTVITVNGTNDAPVLAAALADQITTEDSTWTFQVPAGAFTDVDDGTTLTYSATLDDGSALPSWLLFDAATRTFSLAPGGNGNGIVDVKVTASDGTATASDTFKLTVAPVNDAPSAGPVVLAPSNEDEVRIITTAELLAAGDVDSANLTISNLSASSGALVDNGNGTWTFTPVANDDTGVTFTYTVTDDSGVALVNHTGANQTSAPSGAPDGSFQNLEVREGAITTVDGPDAGVDLALKLETDSGNGRLRFNNVFDADSRFTLGSLSSLKFDYYIESSSRTDTTPVIRIQVDGDGNLATTADRGELVFEWAYQGKGATTTGQWLTADLAGENWIAWQRANGQNIDFVAQMTTLSDWSDANGYTPQGGVNFNANSLVIGWSLASGSGNGTNTFYVDNLDVNGVVQSFEPASSTVTATLDLLPVNDPVTANNDVLSIVENETKEGNVLSNDTDIDTGQTLTVTGVSLGNTAGTVGQPLIGQYGDLTLQADGTYSYAARNTTLPEGEQASETFTYEVTDSNGSTTTADIVVTVTGGRPLPPGDGQVRGTVGPNSVSEGTGDFDGNGTLDYLWRDSTTKVVDIWTTDASGAITEKSFGVVDQKFVFEKTGDLDGNGTDDVIIRDSTTGATGAWIMRDGAPADWRPLGTIDASWEISGTGDFDRNGTDDVLLFNSTTGTVDVWFQTASGPGTRTTMGTVAANWEVAGVGDVDGNGTDDVLWFNDTSRAIGAWRVDQGSVRGWFDYGTLADGWEVTQIGNFNGSGAEDIGFYNATTGSDGAWVMRNGNVSDWQPETPHDDLDPIGAGRLGSGADQIVWHNNVTGAVVTF